MPEAQSAVEEALEDYDGSTYEVTVTIESVAAPAPPVFFKIAVLGEVNLAGYYLVPQGTPKTVLDLVTMAESNPHSILSRVKLTRTNNAGEEQIISINLQDKTGGHFTDSNANLALQPMGRILVEECFCLR